MRLINEESEAEDPVAFFAGVRRAWEGPSLLAEVEKHRARGLRRSARCLMAMMDCRSHQAVGKTFVTRY